MILSGSIMAKRKARKKAAHGGCRKGAGRKPMGTGNRVKVTWTLDPTTIEAVTSVMEPNEPQSQCGERLLRERLGLPPLQPPATSD